MRKLQLRPALFTGTTGLISEIKNVLNLVCGVVNNANILLSDEMREHHYIVCMAYIDELQEGVHYELHFERWPPKL